MLVIALMVRSQINSMGGADTAGMPPEMLQQMRDEAMKAVSIGMGAYLSFLVAIYFSAVSVKNFLLSRAAAPSAPENVHKAAA